MRSLWKGLTPFAGNLTLKYFLRFGTNAFYQNLLRDVVRPSTPQLALGNVEGRGGFTTTCTVLAEAASPQWSAQRERPAFCVLLAEDSEAGSSRRSCDALRASHRHRALWLGAQDGKLSDVRRMAAGFSAGVTEALIIVTPFEVRIL